MSSAVLNEVLAGRTAGLSLDAFEAVADKLTAAERDRDEVLEITRKRLEAALALPAEVRAGWQKLIHMPPAALHARRALVDRYLRLAIEEMKLSDDMVQSAARLTETPLSGAKKLPEARAELVAFADMVLGRWTSQEELEELMAETFELPSWLTNGPIPPHLQPPQSWYDETIDPSKPADA